MPPVKPVVKPVRKQPQLQPLEQAEEGAIFQAIGMIVGDVIYEEGKPFVKIGEKVYKLGYIQEKANEEIHRLGCHRINKKTFDALKHQVKRTGARQRLIVYPRVVHFPDRDKEHQVSFNLLAFVGKSFEEADKAESVEKGFADFEFKLSGLWQFIPVCRTPVVSVFKNYSEERKEFVKASIPGDKVKFLKANHIPVQWFGSPLKPFRFNPKAEKEEQGSAPFVQITTKFNPQTNIFDFVALKSLPALNPPGFLKVGKKDKADALAKQLKEKQGAKNKNIVKASKPVAKPKKKEATEVSV